MRKRLKLITTPLAVALLLLSFIVLPALASDPWGEDKPKGPPWDGDPSGPGNGPKSTTPVSDEDPNLLVSSRLDLLSQINLEISIILYELVWSDGADKIDTAKQEANSR